MIFLLAIFTQANEMFFETKIDFPTNKRLRHENNSDQ
jgi:hypothetical protein